jgi:glycosyltransferase involved in cell wall biosynthesis
MADVPLYSIVTITYENLPGLVETVESVRRQSFRDFEHIVVDGDSSDGTAEWLRHNFSGEWVSEPDDGRYPAMNKGARMSHGEYLWFLHAGDVLGDPDVLARVAVALAERPEWAYGLARVVNPDKSLKGTLGFVPFSRFDFTVLGRPLPHQATVIRRSLFEQLGGYDETVPVAADQLLMLQALGVASPVALPDFLCDFDATGISADRPWWADFRDAERNRRQTAHPVTRWRALDTLLALSFAIVRQVARLGRRILSGERHP